MQDEVVGPEPPCGCLRCEYTTTNPDLRNLVVIAALVPLDELSGPQVSPRGQAVASCFLPSLLLYCTVLHCIALYCTVLHCTALYCTVVYNCS
jgi:hypothetical protein